MTFTLRKNQKVSFIRKSICILLLVTFSQVSLAEYYVVYSTVEYATPTPVVYYQTLCHVKHVIKHKKTSHPCHHVVKKKHKKSSAVVTVYSVVNNCGQCSGACNGCKQVMMPTCQGCGYRVFYGTPVWHSDYYYMRGFNEDDPVIDGNTYDNDIY
jgi:hypothetical protein